MSQQFLRIQSFASFMFQNNNSPWNLQLWVREWVQTKGRKVPFSLFDICHNLDSNLFSAAYVNREVRSFKTASAGGQRFTLIRMSPPWCHQVFCGLQLWSLEFGFSPFWPFQTRLRTKGHTHIIAICHWPKSPTWKHIPFYCQLSYKFGQCLQIEYCSL